MSETTGRPPSRGRRQHDPWSSSRGARPRVHPVRASDRLPGLREPGSVDRRNGLTVRDTGAEVVGPFAGRPRRPDRDRGGLGDPVRRVPAVPHREQRGLVVVGPQVVYAGCGRRGPCSRGRAAQQDQRTRGHGVLKVEISTRLETTRGPDPGEASGHSGSPRPSPPRSVRRRRTRARRRSGRAPGPRGPPSRRARSGGVAKSGLGGGLVQPPDSVGFRTLSVACQEW